MTPANTEEPIPKPDASGAQVAQVSSEEETTGELELLEVTPTPIAVPITPGVGVPPPPAASAKAGANRPPPLPGHMAPQPPLRKTSQAMAAAPPPPPPPGASMEDAEPPGSVPGPTTASSGARSPTDSAPSPARHSPSPEMAAPSKRTSQLRPAVLSPPPLPPRYSPSPDVPAPPPVPPSASRQSASVPLPAISAPVLGAHTVPLPARSAPAQRGTDIERFTTDAAIADARKRVERANAGDRTVLSRARTELGLLLEVASGDAASALTEYKAAHGAATHLLAPISAARRLTPYRPAAPAVALIEAEVRATADPSARATRQLELGLLLAASSAPADRTSQVFREVLAARPGHPGALRGLEAALSIGPRAAETPPQMEALAAHLEAMAATFRADGSLSAWLETERGQLLDKLGRPDAAKAAFETALALDGRIGPVRDAHTRHLLLHGQVADLIQAWATEAGLEKDLSRAARLRYFAGRLAAERLDQKAQAIELFERAASLEQATPSIRRAALRELFTLYQTLGDLAMALATGTKVLGLARESECAHWHRRLVPICEALGRHAEMAAHAHAVLAAEPDDEPMRENLDRALATLGNHGERVATLTEHASRASTQTERLALLLRAARIAEQDMGRSDVALATLRAAWAIDPSSADTCDSIVRLLTPGAPPALTDPEDPSRVRARIDFYIEAAAASPDEARKVAHLEKLALIWEDEVRAPDRALAVYAEILSVEPKRRSAILGLARCAGRAGDAKELLRALVLEAEHAADDAELERSLLLRAAGVASGQLAEPDLALDLIKRVLNRKPGDAAALRAALRIHEQAGRQTEALAQLRALLGQTKKGPGSYPIQAEIARFLEERMHRPTDALTAWREAHRAEPANPTPRVEIRRILLANGDFRAVAEELAALGIATSQPADRGELLLEAAEIYDDRLGDAERAIPLLVDARACLPDDATIVDRLERAYLRTHKRAERLALLQATASPQPRSQFALANLLAEDRDPSKAIRPLADLANDDAVGTAALRALEHALRRTERWSDLAAVLRQQVDRFATPESRLGSVFALLALEEYGDTPAPDGQPTARDLLAALSPNDLLHQEILIRRNGVSFATPIPARILAASLETLAAAETDALASASLHLVSGLLVEHNEEANYEAQKEALLSYAMALESWPDCVNAARGARRIAMRLGESKTFVEASSLLGTLELDPAVRCDRLLDAAEGYRTTSDRATSDNDARAFALVCQALTEDPNSAHAADALIAAMGRGVDPGRASEALRHALDRTQSPDQAAKLGAALAHIALAHLKDQTVALEALRRARKRAPKHVGNLLTLADVCNAMGLHAEAVEAATAAMGISREPTERLRACITLAEVHLRAPAFRDTARREAREGEKLIEQTGGGNGDLLSRLGTVFLQLGDTTSGERVLIAALTQGGDNGRALDSLVTMYGSGPAAGERIATALHKVMAHAETSGRSRRPEWLAALGKVEATMLGRQREGLDRIREAAVMAPARVETYQALTDAHGSAHDEAAREIASMMSLFGRSSPTPAQITSLVALLARESLQGDRQSIAEAADDFLALLDNPTRGSRARSLPMNVPAPMSLGRETLVSSLLHDQAQAPLLDVARLLSDAAAKLVRQDPESLGVASRDRLTARALHPVRAFADRIARGFGDVRFALYLSTSATGTGSVLGGEIPSIVLPPDFENLPEIQQAALLARLLSYVALGVPWVEQLPSKDIDGLLFGALRASMQLWGQGELSASTEKSIERWRPRVAKALSRKVKRSLEEIAQHIRAQPDTSAWRDAIRVIALRASYVATGDLPTALSEAGKLDGALLTARGPSLASRIFEQPTSRELVVFALSDAATALRRNAGTL